MQHLRAWGRQRYRRSDSPDVCWYEARSTSGGNACCRSRNVRSSHWRSTTGTRSWPRTPRASSAIEKITDRLFDLGEVRLKEMDEAGVDIQVLSHGAPSAQKLTGDDAPAHRRARERPAGGLRQDQPDRFAAFGALPTCNPAASANELERIVTKHGFKGAMVHGLTNGQFLDDKKFWPIFERAEKLDVPIYLHPSVPHPAVMDAYYKDYLKDFPMVIRAAWGFTVETATQAIRMVLSGVFDAHPNLKIILGHLGETLPFLVWRVDQALSRPGGQKTDQLPRHLLQPLLSHDQRQFLQSGAAVLRAGDGHRPHHVRDRLAVRAEPARHEVGGHHPAVRGGQDQDPERQRQAAACGCDRSFRLTLSWGTTSFSFLFRFVDAGKPVLATGCRRRRARPSPGNLPLGFGRTLCFRGGLLFRRAVLHIRSFGGRGEIGEAFGGLNDGPWCRFGGQSLQGPSRRWSPALLPRLRRWRRSSCSRSIRSRHEG